MFACCGRPPAAPLGDPFTYIVSTMRVKRSPKAARWGPPSRRRPLVRQAPDPRRLGTAVRHPVSIKVLKRWHTRMTAAEGANGRVGRIEPGKAMHGLGFGS